MKTRISHLGRSSVSVILAVMMLLSTMLIGTVSTVNAIGMSNGACIYFDNSKTNWKDNCINFVIGHNSYSSIYKMNQVTNTDLYYCQMPDWSGATYVAVCGTSTEWGSGNWSSANLTNATHYTAAYTGNFNFESNKSYLLQTSSSTNNTPVTPSYFDSSNGSLNVEVKVDNSTPSSSIADISVNSFKFASSKDSVESTSATISSDSVASTNLETAYSATTTLKCDNIKGGYKFVGWYVDNSLLSSNESYTYNPYYSISSNKFGSISVEARFEQDMSSVADGVTLKASPETVKVGNPVTLTAVANNPASANLTYKFTKTSGGGATVVQDNDKLTVTPTAAGTYEYTVTVSANGYSDVTSAKVTITASYTDTQQAYVDLENYVNSVKDTNAGSYTDDSFADFSTALKSAQALLKGLPDAGATNTDDYTTALNNLKVAYNNLKSNKQYYILGHSAITGGANTSSETTHDKGIPMKDNGNGDYTYTFSSSDIKSGNDAFCFIDNSNHIYKTDAESSINITDLQYTAENPYTVDISSAIKGLYYIGNPTTSKRYTIHLNTATDGKIKVWVEEPPLAYGLQGAVYASQSDSATIGWSNYSESMSFNAENNYTLKFYAKNTNSNANQFRLIDSAQNTYGSNNPSGLKVDLSTRYTTTKSSGNTYYVDYSDKPYTITLINPGENPPTFKVTQGTQYSVTVGNNIENGTISVDNNNPYEGDTVTVTAKPESGYVLETVKFNGESANVVGNKATFTMPNENVTVTATFRTAKKYTVTIANNITNGTVTANGSSKAIVTEGTPVALVASPNDSYSFSSWSITPADGYTAEGSMTSATATIYPTADITVSASFAQGTASADHFLAWGENQKEKIEDWTDGAKTYSSTDENGKKIYTAYLNPSLFKENTWYRFAVTNKIPSPDNPLNGSDLWYNYQDFTVNGSKTDNPDDNVNTKQADYSGNYFGMFQYSGELVSLSISYNEGTKNYQVTPVIKVHNGAKLYAKDGAYRTKDFRAGMNKGKTSISYDIEKYEIDVDTKSSSLWA